VSTAVASFELRNVEADRWSLAGELTFATASTAHAAGCVMAASAHDVHVDCAGLGNVDSAGLAVLLDWIAMARARGHCIHLQNLPALLLQLAKISGVDGFLQPSPQTA
jgi:phospholipid transport system transporter-binding protein